MNEIQNAQRSRVCISFNRGLYSLIIVHLFLIFPVHYQILTQVPLKLSSHRHSSLSSLTSLCSWLLAVAPGSLRLHQTLIHDCTGFYWRHAAPTKSNTDPSNKQRYHF